MSSFPNVLTIAGSDPSGGAGIQADLKTFSAIKVYGTTVITNITAQNTHGINDIFTLPVKVIKSQLKSVFEDIDIAAVKIGMLHSIDIIELVSEVLNYYRPNNIILDPVLVSSSGRPLLEDDALSLLKSNLFPLATMITPNIPEARSILSLDHELKPTDMETVAKSLLQFGSKSVLLKGGHLKGRDCIDVLSDASQTTMFSHTKVASKNTHGTGCTLSSAITANLAKGSSLQQAVQDANNYTYNAILNADKLNVGTGTGPLFHFT